MEGTREGEIAGETSRLLLPRSQECCSRRSTEVVVEEVRRVRHELARRRGKKREGREERERA